MTFRPRLVTLLRRFVLLSFCALALAACEVRSYLDIDMSDPSNGSVAVQVGFDQQFRDAMEEFGGGTDLIGELENDAPDEGWEVDRFDDGDIEGVTLTKEFSSVDELQTILEEGRISGPQEGLIGAVTVTDDGDTIRFEADVPESDDLGSDFEGLDSEQFDGLFTYDARIRVTFPGEVIDHNGDRTDNTVTWTFDDPAEMAGTELFAEAEKGSNALRVFLIGAVLLIVALLVMGVIALIVWQVLRRRQPPSGGLVTTGPQHHAAPLATAPVPTAPVPTPPVPTAPLAPQPMPPQPVPTEPGSGDPVQPNTESA